jgi:hypothetical protein
MYLASKYEDIYPFSSFIAYERISHKAVPQREVLRMEGEILRLIEFNLEIVTPFDFHQYVVGSLKITFADHSHSMKKVEELSLLLIRMALENHQDYLPHVNHSVLTYASICAAATMLSLSFYQDLKHMALGLCKIPDGNNSELCALAKRLEEFYWRFDAWHCGFNQLKRFKSLSFTLSHI